MLLNARKVRRPGNNSQLILLAIQDVTQERATRAQLQAAHESLQTAYDNLLADYERERHIAQALQRPLMLERRRRLPRPVRGDPLQRGVG